MKTEQWDHQAREYEDHRDDPFRALLWQMRTGKSKHTIDVTCHWAHEHGVDGALIVAPNGVHRQWLRRQLRDHWWEDVPYRAHAWDSMARHRSRDDEAVHEESLERCIRYRDGVAVLSVNCEALINDRVKKAIGRFFKGRRVALLGDESHRFRTPGSQRSRIMRGFRKHAVMGRILTGTVIRNSPLAAWAQYEILQHGALGYDTFGDFKNSFALYEAGYGAGGATYPRLTGYKNLDRLTELMAPWSSVVLRKDCEDLPALMPIIRSVEMSEEALRVYNQMKKQLIADIREGVVVDATEGGKRKIKLQQALSGFMIDDEGRVHDLGERADNPRIRALVEEVEGTEGKAIVWCQFREDIKRVCEALELSGIGHTEYHGLVKNSDRDRNLDAFDEDPKVKVLVGQVQAGGEGLDLSARGATDAVIWYSHTSDGIKRDQGLERATLMGGKSIAVVDFECPGTVDTKILADHAKAAELSDRHGGSGLQDLLRFLEAEDGILS